MLRDTRWPGLVLQPETRSITPEELAKEVRSIYAGLTMVESKCIHVDRAQAADKGSVLSGEHWTALVTLHRVLLHEHHDFMLASQHPSASDALKRLATKYSMPARMWKHGVHSMLELLRQHLPGSLDFMMQFIYIAYSMFGLLLETVPTFQRTWLECLGDIARYRMAIEEEDIRDRDNWAATSRKWYTRVTRQEPDSGRLYHHLAILARPDRVRQLGLYTKSLICSVPFLSTRDSISTLFDFNENHAGLVDPTEAGFVKVHQLLFEHKFSEIEESARSFLDGLGERIQTQSTKWREIGAWMASANIGALFDYGGNKSLLNYFKLAHHMSQLPTTAEVDPDCLPDDLKEATLFDVASADSLEKVSQLLGRTMGIATARSDDRNVLPHVYIVLVFLVSFAEACRHARKHPQLFATSFIQPGIILDHINWELLCALLNELVESGTLTEYSSKFGPMDPANPCPLPEDFILQGTIYAAPYFPEGWFEQYQNDEEWPVEHASLRGVRIERILWLGGKLASVLPLRDHLTSSR